MGVNGVNCLALWALDIHEEGVWGLNKSLELVNVLFRVWVNVEEVDICHLFSISNKTLYLIFQQHIQLRQGN